MANKNTNPGGGKNADSGVMHSPQSSRARVRARVRVRALRTLSPTSRLGAWQNGEETSTLSASLSKRLLHLFLRRMMLDGIENRNGSQNRQT